MSAELRPSLFNVYLVDTIGSVFAVLCTLLDKAPPAIVSLFIVFAPMLVVGGWLRRYLLRAKVAVPYDFGFLFWIGWPVLIPIYARRLPEQRRWPLVAQLFALTLAPTLLSVGAEVVAILAS